MSSNWRHLAEYGRRAPSPHNTQPSRLRIVDDHRAELCFVPERGLPVADPEGRFTFLSFGIFVESLRIAAHARGFELDAQYAAGPLYGQVPNGTKKVADLRLVTRGKRIDDFDPELILRRRTNRYPYNRRPIPQEVLAELQDEARGFGHTFEVSTDRRAIRWIKELNRDALYHDLRHDRYREELAAWLRYSEDEAQRTRDGLSPAALVLPGRLLKGFMRWHRLFSTPGLKQLTQHVYMRTMSGISTVGWVQGNFREPDEWITAGHLMMRLWLILTQHGIEWQPYGSIITNDASRAAMVEKFGMSEGEGGRDMVWLLVRMGYSDHEPADSARLPLPEVVS